MHTIHHRCVFGFWDAEDWFNAFFARLWPKIATFVQRLMEEAQGIPAKGVSGSVLNKSGPLQVATFAPLAFGATG